MIPVWIKPRNCVDHFMDFTYAKTLQFLGHISQSLACLLGCFKSGVAKQIEEYVPTDKPIKMGKLNDAITRPPKKYSTKSAAKVVKDVSKVRESVSFTLRFRSSFKGIERP